MAIFARDLGIDLGTANTSVYVKGKGIILCEPSVVAVDKKTKKILAIGNKAKEMVGKNPGNVIPVRPMKDGVIADFDITEEMLKGFVKMVRNGSWFKPRAVVCVPAGVTEVERRAVEEVALASGAREVFLMQNPIAAAIGADLAIEEASGNLVVEIGAGITEAAVISLGSIVVSRSIRIAGDFFDNAIVSYIKTQYGLIIGEKTAEDIKVNIGTVFDFDKERIMEVRGRDIVTGLPKSVTVSSKQISSVINAPAMRIVETVKAALSKTPPELASDILEKGIVLTGGSALLNGMDKLIEKETGIKVSVAPKTLECVAMGTGKTIRDINSMGRYVKSSSFSRK